MLFVRFRDLQALVTFFQTPPDFGIEDLFLDNRVQAQIAIDLTEKVHTLGWFFRLDRFLEERFDLAMLLF